MMLGFGGHVTHKKAKPMELFSDTKKCLETGAFLDTSMTPKNAQSIELSPEPKKYQELFLARVDSMGTSKSQKSQKSQKKESINTLNIFQQPLVDVNLKKQTNNIEVMAAASISVSQAKPEVEAQDTALLQKPQKIENNNESTEVPSTVQKHVHAQPHSPIIQQQHLQKIQSFNDSITASSYLIPPQPQAQPHEMVELTPENLVVGRSPFYHTRKLAEGSAHEIFFHPIIQKKNVKAKAEFLSLKFRDLLKERKKISDISVVYSELQLELINDRASNVQTKHIKFEKKIDPQIEIQKKKEEVVNKRKQKEKDFLRLETENTSKMKPRFTMHNLHKNEHLLFKKDGNRKVSPLKKKPKKKVLIKMWTHKFKTTSIRFYDYFTEELKILFKNTKTFTSAFLSVFLNVLLPADTFRIFWDVLGMILILEELIMIPFLMSFTIENSSSFDQFNTFITFYFIMDMFLNFNTAFYSKGSVIISRKAIIKNYLKGWFWIDMISSFPYEFIDIQGEDPDSLSVGSKNMNSQDFQRKTRILRIIRFLRFAKITRLIRVLKLKNSLRKLEDYLQFNMTINTILECLKLVFTIFFIAHWCACFWYYVGITEIENDEAQTWISHVNLLDSDLYDLYITSLYYSVTTMLTVGFGDVIPITWSEQIFTMSVMFVGCGVFAYAMSSIGTMFQVSNFSLETRRKLIQLNRYMNYREFPKELQARVRRHLEYIYEGEKNSKFSEDGFKALLSQNLKEEVVMEINLKFLLKTRFIETNFSNNLLEKILFIMREKLFVPEEIVINEPDVQKPTLENHEIFLYFIYSGKALVYIERTQTEFLTLEKDDIFGEVSFFSKLPRTASVKSLNFMSCFCLNKAEFLRLLSLSEFDDDKQHYYHIRDSIEIDNDFSLLSIRCASCGETGHLAKGCPKIHYVCDPQLFSQTRKIMQTKFNRSFKRKDYKINSRMEKKKLEEFYAFFCEGDNQKSESNSSSTENSPTKKSSEEISCRDPTFEPGKNITFLQHGEEGNEKNTFPDKNLSLSSYHFENDPENIPETIVTERFNSKINERSENIGDQMSKLNMAKNQISKEIKSMDKSKSLKYQRTTTFKSNTQTLDLEIIKIEVPVDSSPTHKKIVSSRKIKTTDTYIKMASNNIKKNTPKNKRMSVRTSFKVESTLEMVKSITNDIQNNQGNTLIDRYFENVKNFTNYRVYNNLSSIMQKQNEYVAHREAIIRNAVKRKNKKYEDEFLEIKRKMNSKKSKTVYSHVFSNWEHDELQEKNEVLDKNNEVNDENEEDKEENQNENEIENEKENSKDSSILSDSLEQKIQSENPNEKSLISDSSPV